MNLDTMVQRLAESAQAVRALVTGIDTEEAHRRPASGGWSIVEIVNHLVDEEIEDFRRRVDLTLQHPDADWPGIDPPAAAIERRYNDRELEPSIRTFLSERSNSLEWLGKLTAPNWDARHVHPKLGPFSAGDLLCSWVAHDYLHIRQITKRRYEYATLMASPYNNAYAGDWRR